MNKRLLLAGLIFVLVIGVVLFVRLSQNSYDEIELEDENEDKESVSDSTQTTPETPNPSPESSNKISLTELASHNSETDCWVVFEGKVYDITDYIPRHPGGEYKIIPNCGSSTKFEQAFTAQHGRSKVSILMQVGVFIGDFDVVGNL